MRIRLYPSGPQFFVGGFLLLALYVSSARGQSAASLPERPGTPAVQPQVSTRLGGWRAGGLGVEILSGEQGVEVGRYVANVSKKVGKSRALFVPDDVQSGMDDRVVLIFKILRDGKLDTGDPRIESGAKLARLNEAAIFAIRYWREFGPLPEEFRGPYLELRLTFAYSTTPIARPAGVPGPQTTLVRIQSARAPNASFGNIVAIFSDTQGFDFREYIVQVLAQLRREWAAVVPEDARMVEKGSVLAEFSIFPNGRLSPLDPRLYRASGNPTLDAAVLAAILRSDPFESLPQGFHGPYLRLRLAFFSNIEPNSTDLKLLDRKE
jgi:outer membrane biosynthesis protein TonB